MDPVSAALIAAATAGITASATEAGKQLLVDAYTALKDALKAKLGVGNKVEKAAEELNANPKSKGRQATVQEEVEEAKADKDPDLIALANALLEQMKAQPATAQIVQQIAQGDQNVQAAGGSTVTVTYGAPPKKD